ncbi:sensor histidine kinase [Tahibacter soli]|uniref:Sensor histidine kinase n=1 Tax=Tahibacter soli TaxID=2983605 RepID=A0A9X3YM86_9GAMM|nr:sensor histidine kinase [Tahibacter soli]MDC8013840.1 sensor histidine kinase [Tahibacter soli]
MLHLLQAHPNSVLRHGRVGEETGDPIEFSWYPLVMLMWTFWIFATPYVLPNIFPNWLWPTVVSFVAFLWFYARAYWGDRRHVVRYAIGIAALGFLVTPYNGGAQGYIVYACAFLAFSPNLKLGIALTALVLGLYTIESIWLHTPVIYIISSIMVSIAVATMNFLFRRNQQKAANLKLSHDEVRRLATMAERERIGRDLHDLLGHTLSLVALKSELAGKLLERDLAGARREVKEVERVARDALSQVRRAVTGIRAAMFAAETASARLLLESCGVGFHHSVIEVQLPGDVETCLAMSLREAVTNIQRHANAAWVQVCLSLADNGDVVLRIEDDGDGGPIVPGNGLTGMRERVESVGGSLSLEPVRGRGTILTVRIPMRANSVPAVASVVSSRAAAALPADAS